MDKLIETLRRHEGVETHVYKDHLGLETIGVGRCIAPGSLGLSDDEIDYLLRNDIDRCEQELDRTFDWYASLDVVRKEAVINLCFNLGLTRLMGFKNALSDMAAGNYESAADNFLDSRWAQQVKGRAVEVTNMIRTGEYDAG